MAETVELAIPKPRHGSFFPALLEPRRRLDRALWALIMEPSCMGSAPARSTTSSPALAADGNREVLGLAVGDSEDKAFWTAFLRSLGAQV